MYYSDPFVDALKQLSTLISLFLKFRLIRIVRNDLVSLSNAQCQYA